jgi:hypothetical protein
MSVKTLYRKGVKAVTSAITPSAPSMSLPPRAREKAHDKAWRLARLALDHAETAVHDAKNAASFKEAKRKMDLAQTHMDTAYTAHAKAMRHSS